MKYNFITLHEKAYDKIGNKTVAINRFTFPFNFVLTYLNSKERKIDVIVNDDPSALEDLTLSLIDSQDEISLRISEGRMQVLEIPEKVFRRLKLNLGNKKYLIRSAEYFSYLSGVPI